MLILLKCWDVKVQNSDSAAMKSSAEITAQCPEMDAPESRAVQEFFVGTWVVAYFNFNHGKQGKIMGFQQLCIRNSCPICTLRSCACDRCVLPESPYTSKSLPTLSTLCRGLVQHAFYKEKRLTFSQMEKDSGANQIFGQRRQLCRYTLSVVQAKKQSSRLWHSTCGLCWLPSVCSSGVSKGHGHCL